MDKNAVQQDAQQEQKQDDDGSLDDGITDTSNLATVVPVAYPIKGFAFVLCQCQ